MKIKIVVRPEDAQEAVTAAEDARRMRQRRARWGLGALLGLVALSAIIAFFFIGGGWEPTSPEEPSAASAPPPAISSAPSAPPAAGSAGDQAPLSGSTATPDANGAPEAGPEPSDRAPNERKQSTPSAGTAQEASAAASATPGDEGAGASTALPAPAAPPPASQGKPSAPAAAAKVPIVGKVSAKPENGVVRAQLASAVVNREPIDALQSPVNVGAGGRDVYYFNEFRNLGGQTVTHRWEYNGQLVAAIPFKIDGNRWRVYSSKRIGENQHGAWRVTTVGKAGAVLARTDFRAE